jgi:cob(I)alamin adenosyltransferase
MAKAAVYTRTGDKGTTGLYTGQRVAKQSLRVEAYGSVDEINSALGMARAFVARADVKDTIYSLQKLLMSIMADVASLDLPKPYITEEHVTLLEHTIDQYDGMLATADTLLDSWRYQGFCSFGFSQNCYQTC